MIDLIDRIVEKSMIENFTKIHVIYTVMLQLCVKKNLIISVDNNSLNNMPIILKICTIRREQEKH